MKLRFADLFATKTRDEWTDIFSGVDACVTPVLSSREAARHPWNTERDVFALEPVIQPRPAPRFSRTPGAIVESRAADFPGDELRRWGLTDDVVESFLHGGNG
jgi:alpha-methylacyl-CoA racemase